MYFNFLSSNINKGQFSKEEDARLQQLAETYGERDWDAIAKALGVRFRYKTQSCFVIIW